MSLQPRSESTEIRTLLFVTFVVRTSSIVVQSIAPIILVSMFELPTSNLGWIVAAYWIANASGTLIAIGIIRNRRAATIIGLAIVSISFAGFALLHIQILFETLVVLIGLGLSIVQTFLVPSMYSKRKEGRPHFGIGIYSVALSIGLIAGPLLGSVSALYFGFSDLFAFLSMLTLISLIVFMLSGSQRSFNGENLLKAFSISRIIGAMKDRRFANIYLLNLLYSMLLPLFISYGGVYSETHFHLTSSTVLAMFTLSFVLSAVIRVAYSLLRVSFYRTILALGFVCLFFSFITIGSANNFAMLLAGFLLFSVPHALIFPTTTFKALEISGEEGLLSTTYLFATSSGIAEFLSPLAAVPIIAFYNFSSLFLLMSVLPMVALIGTLIPREKF